MKGVFQVRVRQALMAALLATAGTGVAVAPALAQKKAEQPKPPTISRAVAKPLSEAQKAIQANDLAAAKTRIAEAFALPNLTPYDQYVITQFQYQVAVTEKDQATIIKSLEFMGSSEFLAEAERPKVMRNLMGLAINAQDFPKALDYGNRLLAMTPNDPELLDRMGRIALRQKNLPAASDYFSKAVSAAEAAGTKPEEETFLLLASAQEQAKSPQLEATLLKMVAGYPTERNWNFLLFRFQDRTKLTGAAGIDLYRLMLATGAMEQEAEYIEFAEVALQASPGETQRVLQRARAAGKLTDRSKAIVTDLTTRSNQLIALDKKDLPGFEARAKAAKTGALDAQLGDAFMSYGDFAKAIEAYRRALSKGGLKSTDDANMRLGIALLETGDTAGAVSAFQAVTTDPRKKELAGLWQLHANRKS